MGRQSGYVVETKSGKTGYTLHKDPLINGKQPVYLDEGGKLVCNLNDLKVIGFRD